MPNTNPSMPVCQRTNYQRRTLLIWCEVTYSQHGQLANMRYLKIGGNICVVNPNKQASYTILIPRLTSFQVVNLSCIRD